MLQIRSAKVATVNNPWVRVSIGVWKTVLRWTDNLTGLLSAPFWSARYEIMEWIIKHAKLFWRVSSWEERNTYEPAFLICPWVDHSDKILSRRYFKLQPGLGMHPNWYQHWVSVPILELSTLHVLLKYMLIPQHRYQLHIHACYMTVKLNVCSYFSDSHPAVEKHTKECCSNNISGNILKNQSNSRMCNGLIKYSVSVQKQVSVYYGASQGDSHSLWERSWSTYGESIQAEDWESNL